MKNEQVEISGYSLTVENELPYSPLYEIRDRNMRIVSHTTWLPSFEDIPNGGSVYRIIYSADDDKLVSKDDLKNE